MRIFRSHLPTAALALAGTTLAAAQTDTRLPVISRMEVVYSMVSHHSHTADRISFYNQFGQPAGNVQYAVPHLVYEPVVTLYNPYSAKLTLPKCRVRIANPPVGFRFKKNADYLRAEWNDGGPFLGLGRFQALNESNANVQKTITLLLTAADGGGSPGGAIVLRPGESRRFMAWVEPSWTWGLETSSGSGRAFFDFDTSRDYTNKDGRTSNQFGVEAVGNPSGGWGDFRAGFQTDSLSVFAGRPAATRYSFETGTYGSTGWVAMKLTDSLTVEAKGVDTVLDPAVPDFELSLLGGTNPNVAADTKRKYPFSIGDLTQAETQSAGAPTISRIFKVGDLLQRSSDREAGGKTPFARFVMVAKSTALRQRKFQAETQLPTNELYEARLEETVLFDPPGLVAGPSDYPKSGFEVFGAERLENMIGDTDYFLLDVATERFRQDQWKVLGGEDPGAMTTELSSFYWECSPGTGIYKLFIQLPADSPRYFVQVAY